MLVSFDREEDIPPGRIVVAVAATPRGNPMTVCNVLASLRRDSRPVFERVEFDVSEDPTIAGARGWGALATTWRALEVVRAGRVADRMLERCRAEGGGSIGLYDTQENDEILVRADRSIHHVVDGAGELVEGAGDVVGGAGRAATEIGNRLDEVGAGVGEAAAGAAGAAGDAGRTIENVARHGRDLSESGVGTLVLLGVVGLVAYAVLK